MTQPLDLGQIGDDGVRRALEGVARLLVDTGGRSIKIRYGSGTITWPGGNQFSNIATISHGLDSTPVVVLATLTAGTPTAFTQVATFTYTSTSFKAQMQTLDGSAPANTVTCTFGWVAIG